MNFSPAYQTQQGGKTNQVFFQPRYAINTPGDEYEQEADAVAEQVVQANTPKTTGSFFKPLSIAHIQRKCAHCEEEENELQRKEENNNAAEISPSFERYTDGLNNSGGPLPLPTRSFFESRMGYDFSDVKIHTDSIAAKSAQSINALAYTTGNHIVFNQNQYQLENDNGKKLLAHELTHVMQQTGTIRRKVVKMDEIKDRLTYGAIDWAITNKEAHEVLMILKDLLKNAPADFNDTVQEMDRRGYVQRLYENMSDEDEYNESDLLQGIQNNKVRTVDKKEVIDSCTPEKRKQLESEIKEVDKWADAGIQVIVDFDMRAMNGDVGKTATALLDKHFFHQSQFRPLSDAEQQSMSDTIADAYREVKKFAANPKKMTCASPFDRLCRAMAAAYVSGGTEMYFCQSFFNHKPPDSTQMFFHELFHSNANKDDTGYRHERIYKYLPPLEALNNADGYAMLSYEALFGATEANKMLNTSNDKYKDFSNDQATELKQWVAYAARLFNNALNTIGSSDYNMQNMGNAAVDHFKGSKAEELKKPAENYKKIKEKTASAIQFKYIDEENAKTYDAGSSQIKIYRDFFKLDSDDLKIKKMFTALIEYGSSINVTCESDDPCYAAQKNKDAIKNAASYTNYAWKVSAAQSKFHFAVGYIRYSHDMLFRADQMIDEFMEGITDAWMQSWAKAYLTKIKAGLKVDLEGIEPSNKDEADSIWGKHEKRLKAMMLTLQKINDWYSPYLTNLAITGLLLDVQLRRSISAVTELHIPTEVRSEILTIMNQRLTEIEAGTLKLPDPWPALVTLKTKYDNIAAQLPSYYPAFEELNRSENYVAEESTKRGAGLKKPADELWFRYEITELGNQFSLDLSLIKIQLDKEPLSGQPFDKSKSSIATIETLKKDYTAKIKTVLSGKKEDSAIGSAMKLFIASQGLKSDIFKKATYTEQNGNIEVSVGGKLEFRISTIPALDMVSIKKAEAVNDKILACYYEISKSGDKFIAGSESCSLLDTKSP